MKSSSRNLALADECTKAAGEARLANFGDASQSHYRRFPLSIRKASGLLMIRGDATKSFIVAIKDGNLPVTVFAPHGFSEYCGVPNFHLEKCITVNRLATNELPVFP
jgi:hypothetical protein